MEKKYLVLLLISLFLVSGCVDRIKSAVNDIGGVMRGPESTAEKFVDKVLSGDLEGAANMMVTRDLEPYTEVSSGEISVYEALNRNFPYEIGNVKTSAVGKTPFSEGKLNSLRVEEGYRVDVSVSIEMDSNDFSTQVPVEVVNVDGSWKVLNG